MIYISLGSNLGNRLSNLRQAITLLKNDVLSNSYESIIIETKALLKSNSPKEWDTPYLNMIIAGESKLSPSDLLKKLKNIEQKLGRDITAAKWAPRLIDLDILIYDEQVINQTGLQIPHPELLNRDFLIHLLALMPKQYLAKLKIHDRFISADEYAHSNIDCSGLFSRSFTLGPEVLGILNITEDSFSDGGKNFAPTTAIKNAYKMVDDGAEIIDLGAQSTRPGGIKIIGPEKEYERLSPVLDGIKGINAQISIDSYHPQLIRKLIKNYKIDWINDVTGNLDNDILKDIAAAGIKILTMHSLSIPPSKDNVLPHSLSATSSIGIWSEKILEQMLNCGFKANDVIIDPGIGFGKSIYQNLELIREVATLKASGCKLLIGHSRKSFIGGFYDGQAHERDLETLAISNNLVHSGADFIRIHNIRDHHRLLVANKVSSI
ncbi:MAG: dihydropteroate synthase [Rickettsiaceae bacterium]|nr:dihydropteroate synthase [Rickettsiaceae bacterium]MDP5083214.1 dihydropteroate synthase [Rickettsiaceae bacterium]